MARMLMAATLALGLVWAGSGLAGAPLVPGVAQAPGADPSGLLGRWTRKIDKTHVRLEIEEGRLHLRCTGEQSLVIHADYQITRDRVVYGIITSVEFEEEDPEGLAENLVDAPFSFGFRLDEGVLSIRDLKCTAEEFHGKKWNGRFKAAEPEKPVRQNPPPTYSLPPQPVQPCPVNLPGRPTSPATPPPPPPLPSVPSVSLPGKTSMPPQPVTECFDFWKGSGFSR